MIRSPFYYPVSRAGEVEGGGAADLQTDIMRFMAILALCLVAIFALVQSLPLGSVASDDGSAPAPVPMQVDPIEPVIDTGAATPVAPSPGPSLNEPIDGSPPAVEAEAPTDRAAPAVPEPPAEPALRQPAPTPDAPPPGLAPRIVVEAPAPPEPLPAESVVESPPAGTNKDLPAEEGFTLRFESDAALARLVARNEVGLYAIGPRRSLRMSVNRGSYAFWSASAPNQYHEMDAGTVPVAVVAALRRSGSLGLAPDVKWGVTLPARMRRQLGEYLAGHASGALVIEGDGNLRLEP